jgi:hypothetical protein
VRPHEDDAPQGLPLLTGEHRRDLIEIIDDRHHRGSTIITNQVPIDHWHEIHERREAGDPSPNPRRHAKLDAVNET